MKSQLWMGDTEKLSVASHVLPFVQLQHGLIYIGINRDLHLVITMMTRWQIGPNGNVLVQMPIVWNRVIWTKTFLLGCPLYGIRSFEPKHFYWVIVWNKVIWTKTFLVGPIVWNKVFWTNTFLVGLPYSIQWDPLEMFWSKWPYSIQWDPLEMY